MNLLNSSNISRVSSIVPTVLHDMDVSTSNLTTNNQATNVFSETSNALSRQQVSRNYTQIRDAVPAVIQTLTSGAGRGILENRITHEQAGDVISSVMNFTKPRYDNITMNATRQLTEGGTFSQYDVIPSVVNALRLQPDIRIMTGTEHMTTNVGNIGEISAVPSMNTAFTQSREMIHRMAERSVMREVLDRVIPQVTTQQITRSLLSNASNTTYQTQTADRINQLSTLRDMITHTAQRSVLQEAYSRFTGENSALREIKRNFVETNAAVIPHAMGGIFSTPHIGLIAEAGREAVIPLEDNSRGIPLLMAAANEIMGDNIITNQPYSMPMLIQQYQNQAIMSGQSTAQTQEKPSSAGSKVTVNVDVKPADVYIDGERIGRISFRWSERQSIRSGMGS